MTARPRYPLRITLLLGLVLITTALNVVRLLTAIAWSSTLERYLPAGEVIYIGVTGAFWSAVGLLVLWSFARGGRYTRLIILAGAGLYAFWVWADRLVVQSGPQANWPFALAATILLLGYTAIVALDPHNRIFFRREKHERKPEGTRTP
jgi:hypothetical protein